MADQIRTGAPRQGDGLWVWRGVGPGAEGAVPDDRLDRVEQLLAKLAELADINEVEPVSKWRHVVVWFLGVIVASCVPFVPLVVHNIDSRSSLSVYAVLGRGDLLVISLVFTIAGFMELGRCWKQFKMSDSPLGLMIGGILIILAEGLWYGDITSQILSKGAESASAVANPVPTHAVTYGSLLFFAASAAWSLRCVHLAAGVR